MAFPFGLLGVGVEWIDPSCEDLASVTNVATAAALAGITGTMLAGHEARLGGPLSVLWTDVLIDRADWDAAVVGTVADPDAKEGLVVAGLIHKAALETLRRTARLRLGVAPRDHP